MLIVPLACDLWFGCLFPESTFWDTSRHSITLNFCNHLTTSFTAELKAGLGDHVFFSGSPCTEGDIEAASIAELQQFFTSRKDAYMGLQIKSVIIPDPDRQLQAVFLGWPVVDFSNFPPLLKFDENLENRLRRFFKPAISGLSIPVLLNMDNCIGANNYL
jgi:hypothetical protein